MKKVIYTSFILQFLFVSQVILAQCASPENIYSFTYQGNNYEIVKENLTWVQAAACAVERGGFLTEIYSQEQQDSIFFYLNNAGINPANTIAPDGGGASYVWIGGNDIAVEGSWMWDGTNNGEGLQFWQGNYNGTPVNDLYNNWGNEPDNWNTQNGLGLAITNWPLGVAGQWNDVDDSNNLYYVIEYNTTDVGQIYQHSLIIYPNPSNGIFEIKNIADISNPTNISVADITGKTVYTQTQITSKVDLTHLKKGVYFVRVKTAESIYSQKIVVQ